MSDQEDTLQINTSNQFEEDRKLAKKKKFLADKKSEKHKKVIKTQGGDGVINKKFKLKKLENKVKYKCKENIFILWASKKLILFPLWRKPLEKTLKKVKKSVLNETKDAEGNVDDIKPTIKRSKKFEKNSNHTQSNSHSSSGSTSKMAKFSSLFKNNHEIPRVGE